MMETDRYMCVGCGTEIVSEQAVIGFHTKAEHDPRCDGSCQDGWCPIQVQCGPIEKMERVEPE